MKLFFYLTFFLSISLKVEAHTFIGMIGFYDGLSHPVLGLDHFLAMVSVGIVSAQIGGRAIWTVPATFVLIMIVGGIIGIVVELKEILNPNTVKLSDIKMVISFADYLYTIIEIGIIFSVIALGLTIAIKSNLPVQIILIFVAIFGFFHGAAHGLEMPQAINPILFAMGFTCGTAILHIFGVIIGTFSIKTKVSHFILCIVGICFVIFGIFSLLSF